MKIDASGVVMMGICSVQSERCTAKDKPSVVTAVWSSPGRRQIDVCAQCLVEMIQGGKWEAEDPLILRGA